MIVGAGEVGPLGSSRTRFELEVEDHLSPAGVIELAWTTGLIVWENEPVAGWHDVESGEPLSEAEVVEKYGEQVESSVGIRSYRDDGALVDGTAPLMVSVFLEEDTSFVVRTEDEAKALVEAAPKHTRITPTEDGDWLVTRLAGSEIKVPRRFKLSRLRRRPDPRRVRPVGVGPRLDDRVGRPARGVEPRGHRGRVRLLGLRARRAAALDPPDEVREHPGHRHRRDAVHPQDVRRRIARRAAPERRAAGGAAERDRGAHRAVLPRWVRLDGAPGRRLCDRRGQRRGGCRQDPPRQGQRGRDRWVRRPRHRGHPRLRQHERDRRHRRDARQGHRREARLPAQRPPSWRVRRGPGRRDRRTRSR